MTKINHQKHKEPGKNLRANFEMNQPWKIALNIYFPKPKKTKASRSWDKSSKNQPINTLPVMGYEAYLTPDTDE